MEDNLKFSVFAKIKQFIKNIFSISSDKADDELIDQRIRNDVEMRGSNLWVLIFAIFIASIGLNVNSAAVIVGAMLISPLMGPIMGIGYSAGINDFALLRKSFLNIFIASLIALLTSTLYFLITPLDIVQSELIARTSPNIWDVLIALFGGLAGILGITRKEKSNVIPGVAIATALMPPLCTAGFGLATSNTLYFFGAFYMFAINFVFIAFSAFIFVRVFNITEKKYVDIAVAKKAHTYILVIVLVTMLPSLYLATVFVKNEIFEATAKNYVAENFDFNKTSIAQVKIRPQKREIDIYLIGKYIGQDELGEIKSKLDKYGLSNTNLKIYQNDSSTKIDLSVLKSDISKELFNSIQKTFDYKTQEINNLQSKVSGVEQMQEYFNKIPIEIKAIFPYLNNIVLSHSAKVSDDNTTKNYLILNATSKKQSNLEKERIINWLKVRTNEENILVFISKE